VKIRDKYQTLTAIDFADLLLEARMSSRWPERIAPARLCRRVRAAGVSAARRVSADVWALVQQTIAGTLAWVLAKHIAGHHVPFFAPIAAVVALNAARGERGTNALQLLAGVLVGIVASELALASIGAGYGSMALSLLGAMVVARAFGGTRLVVAQAAASAILTIVSDGQTGINRIIDVLIGAGVALVFSQLLFTPEPLALLRRAESAALATMVSGLRLTVEAFHQDDRHFGDRALNELRNLHERLTDLHRMRRASMLVPRYSLAWRLRPTPAVQEERSAGDLELLGIGCLMLVRAALAAGPYERQTLAPHLDDIVVVLDDMAADPGARAARQRAADQVLNVASAITGSHLEDRTSGRDAAAAVRMVATDVLVFVGVERQRAQTAVREGSEGFEIPEPPSPLRLPGISKLHRLRRHR
jgi:hypothetical protein